MTHEILKKRKDRILSELGTLGISEENRKWVEDELDILISDSIKLTDSKNKDNEE